MFNPAIKVSDVPQKQKKALPVGEDKEDSCFKLFEQAEKEAPPEKGWDKQNRVKRQHTCFLLMSVLIVRTKYLHMWGFGDPVTLFYVVAKSTVPTTNALFRATALF